MPEVDAIGGGPPAQGGGGPMLEEGGGYAPWGGSGGMPCGIPTTAGQVRWGSFRMQRSG